ncbi:MAG: group 1 truncated hemoglobin [Pseudomonadota bacterium]
MATIYEKYGGFAAINRAVLAFYEKVLDSDVIGDRFENVRMDRLIDHQTKFLASLLGGPASSSPEHLRQVHHPLRLTEEEFAEMAVLLRETLEEHGFAEPDVATVIDIVEGHRRNILPPGGANG